MLRWVSLLLVAAGVAALAACAAKETAPPAPAAPAPEAKPVWQEEWERLLAEAKREGKVAVMGPPGALMRKALADPFEKKYGITVEYLGATGGEHTTRIRTEREAGQSLWDIYIQGVAPAVPVLTKAVKAFEPIESAFILPEVKELKSWRGGRFEYADKERTYYFVMALNYRGILFVNPNLVKPEEFRSYKDLLDPKWKGKMGMDDPRVPGPGQSSFTHFYKHPELGPDFIRALARQDLSMVREYRQQLEWLGQGRFPVFVGASDREYEELVKQGVPIAVVPAPQLREGTDVSPTSAGVALFNRAAHPNAAKAYLNWLLGKEAQAEYNRAAGFVSRRADVPTDHLPAWRVPKEGAIESYTEETQDFKNNTILPFLREVFGR